GGAEPAVGQELRRRKLREDLLRGLGAALIPLLDEARAEVGRGLRLLRGGLLRVPAGEVGGGRGEDLPALQRGALARLLLADHPGAYALRQGREVPGELRFFRRGDAAGEGLGRLERVFFRAGGARPAGDALG